MGLKAAGDANDPSCWTLRERRLHVGRGDDDDDDDEVGGENPAAVSLVGSFVCGVADLVWRSMMGDY